jgi:peptide/nickel transport system substrate-binding protein
MQPTNKSVAENPKIGGRYRQSYLLLLTVFILMLFLPACGEDAAISTTPSTLTPVGNTSLTPSAASKPGKQLMVVGTSAEISTLDPQLSTSFNDTVVTFNLFDNLVTRDNTSRLQPGLATDWRTLDNFTWQFRLRRNVTFHNGDPFTAQDVKFTLERTYDPAANTIVSNVFTVIDRINIIDDYTLNIVTRQPDPLLPARLASFGGQILPSRYFQQMGATNFARRPVGTGPVRFVEWQPGQFLKGEAYANYWGGVPAFREVIFKSIPDVDARVRALLNNEADIVVKVPAGMVEKINRSSNARVESTLFSGLYVMVVNSKVPPLDKVAVRQALSLAINREWLVKNVWGGQGLIATGPVPRGDFSFDATLPSLEYNPQRAQELLKQAGYAGEEIFLETTDGYIAGDLAWSQNVARMWREIGVNVKLEILDTPTRNQKNRQRTFKGVFLSDATSTLQDPDGMIWRLLGPGGFQDYWRDPRFDEVGEKARYIFDVDRRLLYYRELRRLLMDNNLWLPIIQPREDYGVQNYWGWYPYSNQIVDLRPSNLKFIAELATK